MLNDRLHCKLEFFRSMLNNKFQFGRSIKEFIKSQFVWQMLGRNILKNLIITSSIIMIIQIRQLSNLLLSNHL